MGSLGGLSSADARCLGVCQHADTSHDSTAGGHISGIVIDRLLSTLDKAEV